MAFRPIKLVLCFVTVALAAQAGEFVVLANGFRIHADSHTADGPVVRLQTSQGVIEIQASTVTAFEQEEYTAPATPAVVPIAAVPAATNSPVLTPQELVTRAALHAGLPPAIVHSIARAESGYREDALSPKGAIGLMQLMPKTAAGLDADPNDPVQNAEAGARYLRDLLQRYENDPHQVSKAVAAYNAGPAAVDKYNGIPPYPETVQYVNRVLKQYQKEQAKQKAD
ncbi:MAG TPA: lytic transglycosylase domain-containing protein [Bryobacteraceae bacterium]|nr:lytic transglycosylase domain-containing protein [Bryobacteraceae bacterium]